MSDIRQIVQATYVTSSEFVTPKGIDLKSEDVKDWWIRWDTLRIEMKDGRIFVVQPRFPVTECNDFVKFPTSAKIAEDEIDEDDYDDDDYVECEEKTNK